MEKRLVTLCVLIFCTIIALAQGSVKGKVHDKQSNDVLQYVNVKVSKNGKMVKGAITDANGSFHIVGLSDGTYDLQVSFVGYKNLVRRFTLSDKNRQVSYPALYITEDAQQLKEVQVTGQRSQMKLEVDRKSFTVDQILAAAGGTASDLLENIPSVEVTTDGEISLRGNSSVEVWINGKASGLTADNRGDILQQIPAESIERIEIIDNPSAKFSAEGSAGIINIILKRDRKAGYYGSLRTGVNNSGGWNVGGNFNYSSGKLDANVNVGYRKHKGLGWSESEQHFLNTNTYQNTESEDDDSGQGIFTRANLTFHLSKKDELSFSGMAMFGNHDDLSEQPYYYGIIGNPEPSYVLWRTTTVDGKHNMLHGELGYTHEFGEKHKLTANLSWGRWKSDNDNFYQDALLYSEDDSNNSYSWQYRPLHINNRSWEAKLEYENQITDRWKLEAGYNGRFSHENTPQESWIDTENWEGTDKVEETAFFNRFIYDIDTHALYATVTTNIGKLGIMAGLRGEYWKVYTESLNYEQEHGLAPKDEPFKKDYFQLFPSLFLNYQFTPTAQIQLNYTRRLRRPWGGQLNSFRNTSDASIITYGNPLLTPEYTHSISLNFLKTWNAHTLSVSTYYRPTTDVIQRVRYQSATDGMMYSTHENVSKSQSLGVELIVKNKLWRRLDLTTTINGYYYKLDGFSYVIDGQTVSGVGNKSFSWDARLLASLILPYDISIQATGNYRSRSVITQGHRRPNASLDLGLRKTFFNKALTLSLNWRDVFGTRKWENYTSSDTFWRHQKNWRKPRFNVTISWNFGNMNNQKRRPDQQGGQDDEYQTQPTYEGGEE